MNTPFDKAAGDFPEKDPLSRLPISEDSIKIWLRNLNLQLCAKTPPISGYMGGDKEGGNEPYLLELDLTLKLGSYPAARLV